MKEIYVRTKLVNGTYVYAPKGTKDTYGTVLIDNYTLKYDDNNKLKVDVSVINREVNEELWNEINKKLDKTAIVQETGNSTTKVMSQNAVTKNFASLVNGKVPASQLPSYVDDVLEYDSKNDFPAEGEQGIIYVDKSTNLTYRWSSNSNNYIMVGGGDLNIENGTGDVLIQTTDPNQSFKVMTDGRAKVQSAPVENDDVVRKKELDKAKDDFNLKNGAGTKSVEQVINNGTNTTIPISTKNPNAVSLGAPANVNVGAVGESTSSFGGASNATGKCSHSEGTNTVAIGKYSHAEGDNSVALGNDSHAEGITTVAKGRASHSEGSTTQSIGDHSHAEGSETISSGYSSHSEGGNTQASGLTAHAEGSNTIASGTASHAEGSSTQATIDQAHAEGLETKASGTASHSEGVSSTSEGAYSHAEGYKSTTKKTAYTPPSGTESGSGITGDAGDTGSSWNIEQHRGEGAHSEGILTQSSGYSSHSEGVRTVADGHYSHSEGQLTYAKGSSSHAEGLQTNAEGKSSHAEGSITKAIGHSSHAEGYETTASGDYSHAEGCSTQASHYSHSEGHSTVASGFYSHSEGSETEAKHEASHAEGAYTRTSRATQHVGGKYNADNSNALFIIGNGDSDSNRRNAFEVLADGRAKVQSAPVENDDVVRLLEVSPILQDYVDDALLGG